MRRQIGRSLVVGCATAILVAIGAPPALAASGSVLVAPVNVSYSPGLDLQQAANQEVSVSTPWVHVARGDFDCATDDGGQAHFHVDGMSFSFYGGSLAPETLPHGTGEFTDGWIWLTGTAKVEYADSTVIYHGTSSVDFNYPDWSIADATYNRTAGLMQIHVPARTVTLFLGANSVERTCAGVTTDITIAGAPTGFDEDGDVTSFTGAARVVFS